MTSVAELFRYRISCPNFCSVSFISVSYCVKMINRSNSRQTEIYANRRLKVVNASVQETAAFGEEEVPEPPSIDALVDELGGRSTLKKISVPVKTCSTGW